MRKLDTLKEWATLVLAIATLILGILTFILYLQTNQKIEPEISLTIIDNLNIDMFL